MRNEYAAKYNLLVKKEKPRHKSDMNPVRTLQSFASRTAWLSSLTGGPVSAAGYLIAARFQGHKLGRAAYGGRAFQFRTRDMQSLQDILIKHHYAFLIPYLEELRHAPRIVELGAGIGAFSLWAFGAQSDIHIYALEADADAYDILRQNHAFNPNLAWHLRHAAATNGKGHDTDAPAMTFSEIVDDCGFTDIDLMKLDLGGIKLSFLAGEPQMLNRVRRLIIELDPVEWDEAALRDILTQYFNQIDERPASQPDRILLDCQKL